MGSTDRETELIIEMRRVLHGQDPEGTNFFAFRDPVTDEQLAAMIDWLRSLPSGLGEAGVDARLRAQFGPPPGADD